MDWTQPIQHIDGTPLAIEHGPDNEGDYYLLRADGKHPTARQINPNVDSDAPHNGGKFIIVLPDGRHWNERTVPIVRNSTVSYFSVDNTVRITSTALERIVDHLPGLPADEDLQGQSDPPRRRRRGHRRGVHRMLELILPALVWYCGCVLAVAAMLIIEGIARG